MSKFTSNRRINTRWRGNDFVGAAGSSHTFPNELHDEFLVDWAYQIQIGEVTITETPTTGNIQVSGLTVGNIVLTGTATGSFGGGGSGNSTVYYQTTQPTGGTYAAGDLWVDSDAFLPSPGTSSSVTVSAPIINSGTSTNVVLGIQSASTTAAGAVQLSDSASTTSSSLAATATAVKAAKDAADGKVATVIGTSPISTTGTTAITVIVASASTSASGVVQLSDSVSTTSSVLAATPTAVKAAYDLTNTGLASYLFGSTIGSSGEIPNAPHFVFSASVTTISGTVYWTRIVPYRTITVSNLSFGNGTASSGLTTARFGIYTRSGGTFTLQARTASDTTIFNSTNSKVTRALDTTGGYPATYTMTAGTEYWLAVIQVGTTIGPLIYNNISSVSSGIFGIRSYTLASQSDLPASTSASSSATALYYGSVS
jgi:hypothetical protein